MWTVEPVSETVQRIRAVYKTNKTWNFRILVSADRHIDNKFSNLKLQKKHLDLAKEYNAPVLDIGDYFCAMQGNKDPRHSRVANQFNDKEEYFDAIVDYGLDFAMPYKEQFAVIGIGNHETSVLKHNETHLTKRLVRRLGEAGSPVIMGGYSCWVKILFEIAAKGCRQTVNIRYTHGSGGSSPVTKGVIKTNRRAVSYPDANIVISGHTHESYAVPIPRERLSDGGNVFIDEQLHCQVPSYKDETTGQGVGFAVEKELSPKIMGAVWLKFWYDRDERKIKYDSERAL